MMRLKGLVTLYSSVVPRATLTWMYVHQRRWGNYCSRTRESDTRPWTKTHPYLNACILDMMEAIPYPNLSVLNAQSFSSFPVTSVIQFYSSQWSKQLPLIEVDLGQDNQHDTHWLLQLMRWWIHVVQNIPYLLYFCKRIFWITTKRYNC